MTPHPFPNHVPAFEELLSKACLANEGNKEIPWPNFSISPLEQLDREARAHGEQPAEPGYNPGHGLSLIALGMVT